MQKGKSFTCVYCATQFSRRSGDFKRGNIPKFCSQACFGLHTRAMNSVTTHCNQGNMEIRVQNSVVAESKTNRFFCTQSCAATFNNTHKIKGYRRSKIECYLECRLHEEYADLPVCFNDKSVISSELDLYFPTIGLAVEVNGPTHYLPIFGEEKLLQIQRNGVTKKQNCKLLGIRLYILDVSTIKYLTNERAEALFELLKQQIDSEETGLEPVNPCGPPVFKAGALPFCHSSTFT